MPAPTSCRDPLTARCAASSRLAHGLAPHLVERLRPGGLQLAPQGLLSSWTLEEAPGSHNWPLARQQVHATTAADAGQAGDLLASLDRCVLSINGRWTSRGREIS